MPYGYAYLELDLVWYAATWGSKSYAWASRVWKAHREKVHTHV